MLRIRFHGRGGQGMKTASRILGSSAFQAGYVVQDAPLYGAERRGAPMMAFTRISTEVILERGAIEQPDLVVVADDTLLTEPAAQPAAGCTTDCTLLINSTQSLAGLTTIAAFPGPILVADFTALVYDSTQSLASLSTALGAAAGRLVGLSWAHCQAGVEEELGSTALTPAQHESNLRLAQRTYELASQWSQIEHRTSAVAPQPAPLHQMIYAPPSLAAPSVYAVANTAQRRTGSWRQFRPVLQADKCSKCWLCFVWCPEAAISLDENELPVVDYDECKGCLLCAHECPTHAFTIEKEAS
jgi:pyruvate ferredoxin oxidoreductase gamma subunit